jgi:hypothetical protein
MEPFRLILSNKNDFSARTPGKSNIMLVGFKKRDNPISNGDREKEGFGEKWNGRTFQK